jgi:hypothetical protein
VQRTIFEQWKAGNQPFMPAIPMIMHGADALKRAPSSRGGTAAAAIQKHKAA